MAQDAIVRYSTHELRVRPWRGRDDTAHITPVGNSSGLSAATVAALVDQLDDAGVRSAVTSAIGPREAAVFGDAGFSVREELALLRHPLGQLPDADEERVRELRRATRRDRATVLDIDHAAFEGFWRLDLDGLLDAVRATPHVRFRVHDAGRADGYAITGRAGTHGFLQRLAVRPEAQGRGIATALVADGMRWLRRKGATSVLVNTQTVNERALTLYRHLGFRDEPHGLLVMQHGSTVQP